MSESSQQFILMLVKIFRNAISTDSDPDEDDLIKMATCLDETLNKDKKKTAKTTTKTEGDGENNGEHDETKCIFILTRKPNEGKQCGNKKGNGCDGYCSRHYKSVTGNEPEKKKTTTDKKKTGAQEKDSVPPRPFMASKTGVSGFKVKTDNPAASAASASKFTVTSSKPVFKPKTIAFYSREYIDENDESNTFYFTTNDIGKNFVYMNNEDNIKTMVGILDNSEEIEDNNEQLPDNFTELIGEINSDLITSEVSEWAARNKISIEI